MEQGSWAEILVVVVGLLYGVTVTRYSLTVGGGIIICMVYNSNASVTILPGA